jgi:hypothetical protein
LSSAVELELSAVELELSLVILLLLALILVVIVRDPAATRGEERGRHEVEEDIERNDRCTCYDEDSVSTNTTFARTRTLLIPGCAFRTIYAFRLHLFATSAYARRGE